MPMAETSKQYKALTYVKGCLEFFYKEEDDILVAGDMFVYYEKGNPKKCLAPDVFVSFDVKNASEDRDTYKTWVEGTGLDVVFEILSETTWRKDVYEKAEIYNRLGVSEYFIFDPTGKLIQPALQGFFLDHGKPMPLNWYPNYPRSIQSLRLDLFVCMTDTGLRLFDPGEGEYMRTEQEEREDRLIEKARADSERDRADSEREDKLIEKARADSERERADSERVDKLREKARADALSARLKELEARLAQRDV